MTEQKHDEVVYRLFDMSRNKIIRDTLYDILLDEIRMMAKESSFSVKS